MSNISNLNDTIIPKSDQLNSEQLLSGSITVKIVGVTRGSAEQPVIINYEGDNGRPYKPCKSMRKVMIFAWGEDGNKWIGRSMTLFNKTDVRFGGVEVGGIRISHMSDIERDISVSLTATRGKKEPHIIKKLSLVFPHPLTRKLSSDERELCVKDMKAAPDLSALQQAVKDAHALAKSIGDKESIAFFNECYATCAAAFND
jgi:hypothetical protein